MPKIGLKRLVGAVLNEEAVNPYSDGFVIGRAISANINITTNEQILYADDMPAESVKEFGGGTLTLGSADLDYSVQVKLLGRTVTSLELEANSSDNAPDVGVGFYARVRRDGTDKWRAVWLYRVKFAEPTDEFQTKGESVSFQTPTLTGTIMTNKTGGWKRETTVDTESAAVTWLNSMAGITNN